MAIKNIIFDFGGVLLDWNPRYLFEKLIDDESELHHFLTNVCSPEWNIEQDRGRTLAEATQVLQKQFPEYHDLIQAYYDRWEEMIPGAIEKNVKLLYRLKEKYPVYGLTNFSNETLPVAMDRFSFFSEFDGIVCSGDEKLIKPDHAIYHLLLDRFGIKAEESLFIDDSHPNILAANELDIHTIQFVEGVDLEQELKNRNLL